MQTPSMDSKVKEVEYPREPTQPAPSMHDEKREGSENQGDTTLQRHLPDEPSKSRVESRQDERRKIS